MARDDDNTGRNLALAAGGGALLWFFLRRGGGLGFGGKGRPTAASSTARRVGIRVDQAGISVEGRRTNVAGAVGAARATGAATVLATGAARQGTVDDLLAALRDAGVKVWMTTGGRHGA
jgi:hypothetical protein